MKKRILIGIAATLCICVVCGCVSVLLPKPVLHYFKYSELDEKIVADNDRRIERNYSLEKSIESARQLGVDEKGHLRPDADKYGFIGVVEPLYCINYVFRFNMDVPPYIPELLSPIRVYDDLQWRERLKEYAETSVWSTDSPEWGYRSRVVTVAKIKEVFYLPQGTELKVGDTIRIYESYEIYDQRVPQMVDLYILFAKKHKDICGEEVEYVLNDRSGSACMPLEDGETYFLCGSIYTDQEKEEMFAVYKGDFSFDFYLHGHGNVALCLSDKTKPAGTRRLPKQVEADYVYLAEHFGY